MLVLWAAVGIPGTIHVDVGGFQVVVHVHTIIMHINKPHSARHSCLQDDGINYQIRLTSFTPLWGSESWNGKPGIPKKEDRNSGLLTSF